MTTLLQFMKLLGTDAALADAYHDAPEAVIARFDLDAASRQALLDKDYEAIKRLTGLKDGQFATNSTVSVYSTEVPLAA